MYKYAHPAPMALFPHQRRLPLSVRAALGRLLHPRRAPFTRPPTSQGPHSLSKAGRFPVTARGSGSACAHAAFPRPSTVAFRDGSAQETAASSPGLPPGRVLYRSAAKASRSRLYTTSILRCHSTEPEGDVEEVDKVSAPCATTEQQHRLIVCQILRG